MTLDAVILCAGRGERLRPLTDVCPKPLLPVHGIYPADVALSACDALGPIRRLANAHHLPDMVLLWAQSRRLDGVQVEPVLLDSGGVLARLHREGEVRADHLVVHNADILHRSDLKLAWQEHLRTESDITLLTVSDPHIDTVVAHADWSFLGVLGHPCGPGDPPKGAIRRTFCGIAFYRRSVLEGWPDRPWSIKDLWHRAARDGARVRLLDLDPAAHWIDCGTPADLARAALGKLTGSGPWIDPLARVDRRAVVGSRCVVEAGARVEGGADIDEVVLLPGAIVHRNEHLRRIIRNPGGETLW